MCLCLLCDASSMLNIIVLNLTLNLLTLSLFENVLIGFVCVDVLTQPLLAGIVSMFVDHHAGTTNHDRQLVMSPVKICLLI